MMEREMTKEQLIRELAAMQQRVAELETLEDRIERTEKELQQYRRKLDDMIGERTAELEKVNEQLRRETTELKEAAQELKESEDRYRSFVQNFHGIAYRAHMNWIPIFFHGAVEEITGYTENEFTSGNPRWDQVIYPEDWRTIRAGAEKIRLVPGYSTEREYRIVRKDGRLRWVHEVAQNICDESGKPVDVQGVIYDVTERKEAVEELERRNRELGVLNEIYWIINSSQDRNEVLNRTLEPLARYCDARTAAFYDIDQKGGCITIRASLGVPEDIKKEIECIGTDDETVKAIVESKGIMISEEDLSDTANPRDEIKVALGIKKTVCFPLRSHGMVNAIALIGCPQDEKFSMEKRRFFDMVGNQLGIALEGFDLFDVLQKRERELNKLTAGLIDSIENERHQIALSLHDEMRQSLAAVNVEIDILERGFQNNDIESRKSLEAIRKQISRIAESSRRLSYSLHPSMLGDLGLIDTLNWYAETFVQSESLQIDIEAAGFNEELPMQIGLTLYRVSQEALTNVVRHADADYVSLRITRGYPHVIMVIEDNGKGFAVEDGLFPKGGLGLVGMRERTEKLGGKFRIHSSPGKGTRIRVTLPLEVNNDHAR